MKTYKIYETFLRGKKRLCPVPLLLVVGVLICCGCKDELSIPVPLAGTKWKLAGIVDMETGALRELEPKDCAGCYTLVFDSDHTASGCSLVSAKIRIDLLYLDKYMSTDIGYEPNDVNIFRSAMVSIKSYAVTSEELKLYYINIHDNKMNYLFFKRIKQ